MFELGFTYSFETAHRFTQGNSKCSTPHGHSWRATLEFQTSSAALQTNQMIDDFANLKRAWRTFITQTIDHSFLHHAQDPLAPLMRDLVPGFRGLAFPGDPTTEMVAALFLFKAKAMGQDLPVLPCSVMVQETATNQLRFHESGLEAFLRSQPLVSRVDAWWKSPDPFARHYQE